MLKPMIWLPIVLLAMIAAPALSASDGDRVQVGRSIVVGEGETAGSLVCIGCSIRMQGTSEDVVAIGGSVAIEGRVQGDIVAIGGAVRLGENASADGDVVSLGGKLRRDPRATIKGSVTSESGITVLIGLVIVPLLPIILFVAFIIWLINRNRQPAALRT
jgi:hypothetical protein